jgi:eukaryotic-like serine/threonine-protein kinase
MTVKPHPTTLQAERELFLDALEKTDPGEREAFLLSSCAGNQQLRRRVEELLAEQESVGNFLDQPAWAATGTSALAQLSLSNSVALLTEKPGDQIGPYVLVGKLGEGGCGVVYEAIQQEPLRRDVALKIIKLGMDTRQVIARFEAERQTLALMEHSSIAKVFDAGATRTGRPYFVMELVRGLKLTEHCDLHQLGLAERLRLFIQVCQGIQHAHQKGVIHRDIKPSNILVSVQDGESVPKIIDFGIARAIHRQLAPQLTEITGFGQLIGTPAYMSPEQTSMRPVDIDTRSDIYSLGVLLYELLTGVTPFDGGTQAQDPDEWRRLVRDQQPCRPSTRLSALPAAALAERAQKLRSPPQRIVQALRGDLDWVVIKALEKDRSRRYSTARELAQDLEYYLADEPVLARPPSGSYRLQKLAQRHWPALIAISVTAAVLVVATAISAALALRATQAETDARLSEKMQVQLRRQAELERERAQSQADAARLNEYVADINLAQQALASGNYGRAVQLLKKHSPKRGVPDLRGFEWRYLWKVSKGDEHVKFPDQESSVRNLTVSPNGRWLAVGTDNHVNLWDLSSSSLIHTYPVHQISVVFCDDGRQLVVSTPFDVRVIDLSASTETVLPEQDGGLLAASKDGARLAISGRDGVRLWDTRSWSLVGTLPGAFAPLAFSPRDGVLATATREGLALWDVDGFKRKLLLRNSQRLFFARSWDSLGKALVFSPDGSKLMAPRNVPSETGSFSVSLWSVESGEELGSLPRVPDAGAHTGTIASLAVSPDGKTLATASMDHSVHLWDLQSNREPVVLHGHLSEVWSVSFSQDGATLITGAKDGSINLWPIPPEAKQDFIHGPYHPVAFSRDGQELAILDQRSRKLLFLDPFTQRHLRELQLGSGLTRGLARFALSSDLRVLADVTATGVIRIQNTLTGAVSELSSGRAPIFDLALSADGSQMVTGGMGQSSRWWDLARRTNSLFSAEIRHAVFSPDDQSLLILTVSGRAELWDVATRSLRTTLKAAAAFGPAAAFSPDGRVLAIASDPFSAEQWIGIWDTATGHPLGTCIGHKQGIVGLAFSSDGRTLASLSHDSTLKLWNTASLQQMLSFSIPGEADSPLFSPRGTLLVVGQSFQPNGLRLYPAPQPDETVAARQISLAP